LLPFEDTHLFVKPAPKSSPSSKEVGGVQKDACKSLGNKSEMSRAAEVVEKKINLGCCCVCHETDGMEDCEWCVDCR
jgi:hypothetical protein